MSISLDVRPLEESELRRAGLARLRAARETAAGVGCVAALALLSAAGLMGVAALALWLASSWRWNVWGVLVAVAAAAPTLLGALALLLGASALVSYVRRRWRIVRGGWRRTVSAPGPTEALRFEADAAWIIDNNEGEPVGVWRVEPTTYVLAPTLDVDFAPAAPGPEGAEHAPPAWGLARRGRGVVLPGRELGYLDLEGPREPARVIVPPDSAFGDSGDEVVRLLGDWNLEHRLLVKGAGELPAWVRAIVT